MQYFGGKQRVASDIVRVLNSYRESDNQIFFEPFVGGANIVTKMSGKRVAADANEDLIVLYKALQDGWCPPERVSREEYYSAKGVVEGSSPMKAFCGFGCSFAGKWFGGYASSGTRNYAKNAKNSLEEKREGLARVKLFARPYTDFHPTGMLIYCDPPYAGTTQYGAVGPFDTCKFWEIMRVWAKKNTVIVSEYVAPDDCLEVWSKGVITDIRGKDGKIGRVEKLFLVGSV